MNELHYTLLCDGPADKALMPILTWLLQQHLSNWAIQPHWADLRRLLQPPKELHKRIQISLELYPCDLLFVHRDAEAEPLEDRLTEISEAVDKAGTDTEIPPSIGVVPVRMTETWLLFDITAIREASGNPNGTVSLDLPRLPNIENLSDPKEKLHSLMREATELGARRRKQFDVNSAVLRIPEYIQDFSPLRRLPAFSSLDSRLRTTIESQNWCD